MLALSVNNIVTEVILGDQTTLDDSAALQVAHEALQQAVVDAQAALDADPENEELQTALADATKAAVGANYVDAFAAYVVCPDGTGIGWTDNGDGTYTAPAPPAAPALTVQGLSKACAAHLDDTARTLGYDDMLTALSYVGDANTAWDAEAVALRDWRSLAWATEQTIVGEIADQTRAMYTDLADFINDLPAFAPPA